MDQSINKETEGCTYSFGWLVGWLGLTTHRQRGHLETAPLFIVPCEGREAGFINCSHVGIEPRAVSWQSITKPLRHASYIFTVLFVL